MISSSSIMPHQPIPRSSKMPFSRANRRRFQSNVSSSPQNQIEVQGEAYLCFSPDYTTFQGNINTSDESNYSIFGEAVNKIQASNPFQLFSSSLPNSPILNSIESTPNESEDDDDEFQSNFRRRTFSSCSSTSSASNQDEETPTFTYNVALTDHYTGLTHRLFNVEINNKLMNPIRNLLRRSIEQVKPSPATGGHILFRTENIYKGQKADMMIQKHIGSPVLLGKKCSVYSGIIDLVVKENMDCGKSWSL